MRITIKVQGMDAARSATRAPGKPRKAQPIQVQNASTFVPGVRRPSAKQRVNC